VNGGILGDHAESSGGAEGDRTPDLVIANDALSQLSYCPGIDGDFAQQRHIVKNGAQASNQQIKSERPPRAAPSDAMDNDDLDPALGMFDDVTGIIAARPTGNPRLAALIKGLRHVEGVEKSGTGHWRCVHGHREHRQKAWDSQCEDDLFHCEISI
jgi:hypothetical protein